ncbi:MAG: creatininase family protein [Candidatus Aminicenantes bacterium]
MEIERKKTLVRVSLTLFLFLAVTAGPMDAEEGKPLILQEISWFDVQQYLKTSDMVIIPLGSTEQHGPHLPLGTDYYESFGMCKMISEQTGVLVAPVVLAGYSVYHSGFPGTLNLKPETLELVLFETAEMLIKYGFRKFMFFNYHGGNRVAESKVIYRINHTTEAVAVNIGIGSPFQTGGERIEGVTQDSHAGIGETSLMLYLNPELVKMERAQKPKMKYTPQMEELMRLSQDHRVLGAVLGALQAVPEGTKKGGASHEISSNGIWSDGDPQRSTRERGERNAQRMVRNAVRFIEAWKLAKK